MKLTEEEKRLWVAGFLEAVGEFNIICGKAVITAKSKIKESLELLQKNIGGGVIEQLDDGTFLFIISDHEDSNYKDLINAHHKGIKTRLSCQW